SEEGDMLRVLIDGDGLSQVRHHRALVGALLQTPVELRERYHRALEFAGHGLEGARDLGDLSHAVVAIALDLHQLQIVDHNQSELAMFAHHAPRTRTHLHGTETDAVVDQQGLVLEFAHRHGQFRPVLFLQLARTQTLLIYAADGAEHT